MVPSLYERMQRAVLQHVTHSVKTITGLGTYRKTAIMSDIRDRGFGAVPNHWNNRDVRASLVGSRHEGVTKLRSGYGLRRAVAETANRKASSTLRGHQARDSGSEQPREPCKGSMPRGRYRSRTQSMRVQTARIR